MPSLTPKMKILPMLARLLGNRNWTFHEVHYFTWKLEFVSNILSVDAVVYWLQLFWISRLKVANLVSKTDFDNKLISFNKKITLNKMKYLKVQKMLNSLTTKDCNFFLGRIYFKSNGGSQNVCLSTNIWYCRIKKRQRYWLCSLLEIKEST